MRKVLLVLLVGLLAFGAAACSGGDDDSAGEGADAGVAEAEAPMDAAASDGGGEEAGGGGGQDAVAVAQETAVPSVRPRVIQTASLSLSVPRNEFDKVIDRARLLANSTGGFVVESSASQSGDERRLVTGSLVIRVPEQSYARVMERLSALGRVEGREEAGQDVPHLRQGVVADIGLVVGVVR